MGQQVGEAKGRGGTITIAEKAPIVLPKPAPNPKKVRLHQLEGRGFGALNATEQAELRALRAELRPGQASAGAPALDGDARVANAPSRLKQAAAEATARLKTLGTEATRLQTELTRTQAQQTDALDGQIVTLNGRMKDVQGEMTNVQAAIDAQVERYLYKADPDFKALTKKRDELAEAKASIDRVGTIVDELDAESEDRAQALGAGNAYNSTLDDLINHESTAVSADDKLKNTTQIYDMVGEVKALQDNLGSRLDTTSRSYGNAIQAMRKALADE